MNWMNEKDCLIELINNGVSYEKIGDIYGVTGAAVKKAAIRLGIQLPIRRRINSKGTFNKGTVKTSICLHCGKSFIKYPSSSGKFCSRKCANTYHNNQSINSWKSGRISGTTGYTCSSVVRDYMLNKVNYKCELCGWGKINPYTNRVPLHIHHIDGNSENNSENNLQVLCPNCHSLTENFGSRNKNAPRGKSSYYGKGKAD